MVKCCVPGCTSIYKRKVDNKVDPSYITFHRFPKNAERIKQWERVINRPGWSANYNSRICSQHFAEDAYYTTQNEVVFLKVDAMPTKLLLIPGETVKQEKESPPIITKQDPDKPEDSSENTPALRSQPERTLEIKKEPNFTSDTEQESRQILASSEDRWTASLEIEFEPDVKQEPGYTSDMDQGSNCPPASTVRSWARTSDPDFVPCPDDSPVTKKMKNYIKFLDDENAKQKLKIKALTQKVKQLQNKKICASK